MIEEIVQLFYLLGQLRRDIQPAFTYMGYFWMVFPLFEIAMVIIRTSWRFIDDRPLPINKALLPFYGPVLAARAWTYFDRDMNEDDMLPLDFDEWVKDAHPDLGEFGGI